MADQQTTETLRSTLFEVIKGLKAGNIEADDAKVIAILADRIIKTAELEIKYAETVSRLDLADTGVSPGPLLLTNKTEE